ncbi:MAG: cytochrome c biogenesis protein CcdA [Bauldia sp.]
MPIDLTLWGAFSAGLLSFVSPCLLPLVPPYLCFLAGVSLDELTDADIGTRRLRVVGSALAFVLGFSTIFIALGATASAFGEFTRHLFSYSISLFGVQVGVVALVTGLIIIAMGLHFLGVFRIAFLDREARVQVERRPPGPLGAFLIGIAFAAGWTPCIGPVLQTILFVAASEATVERGIALLAAYSAGIGLPFLAAAAFAGPFMRWMLRFRRHMRTVERAMGGLLVATGILFLTGAMTAFNSWLLELFPDLAKIG